MDFSKEELDLLHAWARFETIGRRWGFYIAVLLPVILFAIYGAIRKDYIALLVANIGMFGYVLWRVTSEARYSALFRSIAVKVLAAKAERRTR